MPNVQEIKFMSEMRSWDDCRNSKNSHEFEQIGTVLDYLSPRIIDIDNENDCVLTGFPDLDYHPFLANGSLTVLGGRPAMGTTALALTIVHHVASVQNKAVAIFSPDLGAENVARRLLSLESGVNLLNWRRGQLDEKIKKRVTDSLDTLAAAPIFIDDTTLSISAIRKKIDALKRRGVSPDFVVLDCLQSLVPDRRRKKDNRFVMQKLKAMACEFSIPILVTTILTRKMENRRCKYPELLDFPRGVIDGSVDHFMALYREEYYKPDTEYKGLTDLFTLRSRHDIPSCQFLHFNDDLCKFEKRDCCQGGN